MARAREEESDEVKNAMDQKTPRCTSVWTTRPTPLAEVRPQPGVLRHTALHIVDILPYVQILDVPVPQMGGQLVEFMQNLDTSILDEQVAAVPKIFLDRIPQRSALRRTQKAEQLVEGRRSSRFSPRTGFSQVAARCRADLEQSSSSGSAEAWCRSSRFTPWTEFNSSGRGADRCGLQGFPPGLGPGR